MMRLRALLLTIVLAAMPLAADAALTDSLVAYWKLDEASGTREDAHAANDLTDNNTVLAATGKINDAADFEADNSEHLSINDNADLSTGDIDFTIAGWVQIESKGAFRTIAARRNGSTTVEWQLRFNSTADRFDFVIHDAGGTIVGTATANNLGAPSLATWYYIVAWHDAAANTVSIQVNNGTVNSAATTGVPTDDAVAFRIGGNTSAAAAPWDGLVDEMGFWKRTLTSDERTSLYNGGSGFAYPFTASSSKLPIFNHYYTGN